MQPGECARPWHAQDAIKYPATRAGLLPDYSGVLLTATAQRMLAEVAGRRIRLQIMGRIDALKQLGKPLVGKLSGFPACERRARDSGSTTN